MKKLLIGFVVIAATVAIVPMFAAFEAHVVNVTATIENALSVPTESITFGTVFPQEHLNKPLAISLSSSFLAEGRVDDVDYFIRQKPKCGVTTLNGQTLVEGSTQTGHIVVDSTAPNGYTVDCGVSKVSFNPQTHMYGVLPMLCPYISKHPDGTPANDGSQNSFHQPFTIVNGGINWNDTKGRLAKSDGDTVDTWTIDLAVPCFGGYCAQDWLSFVRRISGNSDMTQAEADKYTQPIGNEHKVFGCDLWVEVSGVSIPNPVERPTVGAAPYVAGTPTCDITVDDSIVGDRDTIQEGVNLAPTNGTVCVATGNYHEFTVSKALTVRGLGDPEGFSSAAIVKPSSPAVGALALVTASDVTITGLQFNGDGGSIANQASGVQISPVGSSLNNVNITYNFIKSIDAASGFSAKGIQWFTDTNSGFTLSNSNFKHNTIDKIGSINKGGYGIQTVGAMTNVAIENNTISNTMGAWGAGVAVDTKDTTLTAMSGNTISLNQIMMNVSDGLSRFAVQVENHLNATGVGVHQNNIETSLHGGSSAAFGTEGTLNAQSNWWGAAAPVLATDVFNAPGSNVTDFTFPEASAFTQN